MPGNINTPTPAEVAAWPTPDYENGVRREWLPAFSIVLLVFSTILTWVRVGLRLRKQGGGFGWDDALLLPSWALLIAFTACVIWVSEAGIIDRHMWDMELYKYETNALNAWIGQFIFLIGTCCIKVSILLFHRRMVKGTFRRRWKWAVWSAIAFTIVYTFVLLIFLIINCKPTESYWKFLDPTYTKDWHCIDTTWINYAAGIFAVVSDFYSLILPWAMIWPLEMPRRQKIGLNAVFGLGTLVIIAAGLRTNSLVALGESTDLTWIGFWLYLWSIVEWNLGIICACAPSLRVLFRKYFKSSIARVFESNSTRKRACGSSAFKDSAATNDTEAQQPARAIEMRRTLTVESHEPFATHNEKQPTTQSHTESHAESEVSTVTDRTASFGSSRRQGVSYVPRAYRIALRQDLSESQETLHGQQAAAAARRSSVPMSPARPVSSIRADQDTIMSDVFQR